MEDTALLRDYVDNRSEAAFSALVKRHLPLVYSVALRRTSKPHIAEEIAQSVFCLLADKARTIRSEAALASWLHQTACLMTAKYWRTEYRRQHRELEAAQMIQPQPTVETPWDDIAPHLDEAMSELPEQERIALLLRFFQGKSFVQVGMTLGVTEDAARMRVNRALEKLRSLLEAKKVACTTGLLGAFLLEHSAQAVPPGVEGSVQAAALKAAHAASTASLLGGLLTGFTTAKLKTVTIGIALCVVGLGLYFADRPSPKNHRIETRNSKAIIRENSVVTSNTINAKTSIRRPAISGKNTAQVTPQSTEARELYDLGWKLQQEKKYDEALDAYGRSIALLDQGIGRWNAFKDVYFSRASLYADLKDYEKSIADHTRRLELDPKYYSSRHNRALYYSYLGKMDEAIADYSVIIDDRDIDYSTYSHPKEEAIALAYEYRGRIYEDRKEYDKALADYSNSILNDPTGGHSMLVYWRRSKLHQKIGRKDLAIIDLDIMSERAMELAATSKSNSRSNEEPLMIVSKAMEVLKESEPYHLEAAAAVNSRYGKYDSAIRYQELALKRAVNISNEERAVMEARLALYRSQTPLISDPSNNRRASGSR
ncbi:MAG TPA: sigma-70 family RNA polymerase sigma factor [Verrucomicrobiae bacterium]